MRLPSSLTVAPSAIDPLLASLDMLVAVIDETGKILRVSPGLAAHSGAQAGSLFDLLPRTDRARATQTLHRAVATKVPACFSHSLLTYGPARSFETTFSSMFHQGRNIIHVAMVDVSRHLRFQAHLGTAQALLQGVLEAAIDAIIATDGYLRIALANPAAAAMFRCKADDLIGRHLAQLLPDPDFRKHFTLFMQHTALPNTPDDGVRRFELQARRRDGEEFLAELAFAQAPVDRNVLYTCSLRDITEQRRLENELERLAHYDALTGLPNRSTLFDRLRQALHRAQRDSGSVGVLFVDLDGFKQVNDQLGHETGDRLLSLVAKRLQSSVRASDTVARLGGDEFVVVVTDLSDPDDALRIADVIRSQLALPYRLDDVHVEMTCSVGVSLYPLHGEEPRLLLHRADLGMYQSKREGKNQVACYRAEDAPSGMLREPASQPLVLRTR